MLFKKFANIDVFDLEIDERDPDKLIDTIAFARAHLGGINLEDTRRRNVSTSRRKLRERMKIPSSMTTSMARLSSSAPPSSTACTPDRQGSDQGQIVTSGAVRPRWPASTCWSCSAPGREHLGHRHQGPGV